jgi:hypothetical protein
MSVPLLLLLAGLALPAQAAQPRPFENGEPQEGEALVAKDCHACHVRRFGDPDRIYTRADRRVNSPAQLLTQIAVCNTELGAGYFPEEEAHVAAYLNLRYYTFPP